jgi:hypothetical protein
MKEADFSIDLAQYGYVHYLSHKFRGLNQVNTIYHRVFISLPKFIFTM